jgi:hypothetical protein
MVCNQTAYDVVRRGECIMVFLAPNYWSVNCPFIDVLKAVMSTILNPSQHVIHHCRRKRLVHVIYLMRAHIQCVFITKSATISNTETNRIYCASWRPTEAVLG